MSSQAPTMLDAQGGQCRRVEDSAAAPAVPRPIWQGQPAPQAPQLVLPSPWAAGVVVGLVRVAPQPLPTSYRGPVRVIQTDSVSYRAGIDVLVRAAQAAGFQLFRDYPARLFLDKGAIGWAHLVAIRDLRRPTRRDRQGLAFLGTAGPPHPWGWVLDSPRQGDLAEAAGRVRRGIGSAQPSLAYGA